MNGHHLKWTLEGSVSKPRGELSAFCEAKPGDLRSVLSSSSF